MLIDTLVTTADYLQVGMHVNWIEMIDRPSIQPATQTGWKVLSCTRLKENLLHREYQRENILTNCCSTSTNQEYYGRPGTEHFSAGASE